MSEQSRNSSTPAHKDPLQGFSLDSVCWGYRDIFARAIQGLFEEGMIGEDRRRVTSEFFQMLQCADRGYFDIVLKEFLGALNPRTAWLMDLPAIFSDVTEMGRLFAESKTYYGVGYFKVLGEGGFGDTPPEVRSLMRYLRRLREVDEELAFAFLKGYRGLVERLRPDEIERYLNEGLAIFARNRQAGLGFMEGTLKSSENVIRTLTRESRLEDAKPGMERLLRALVGYDVEVDHLGRLDSDDLIARGTSVVCMYKWLYVPMRIRHFDSAARNRDWFRLICVTAAGMLSADSFCRIHGHPEYETARDLVGDRLLHLNLFQVIEYVRVLRRICRVWPGAVRLVRAGLREDFDARPPRTDAERLLFGAMHDGDGPGVNEVVRVAGESVNAFDTAEALREPWVRELAEQLPGLDQYLLRTVSFLPDFLYPGAVSRPPADALVADLKDASEARRKRNDDDEDSEDLSRPSTHAGDKDSDDEEAEKEPGEGGKACFLYDEWSQTEGDYYRDFCHLYELTPGRGQGESAAPAVPEDVSDEVRRVRRVFEMLKPDLVRKEKYLAQGDIINHDLLLQYLIQKRREPAPKVNFYEKPMINERDLAVLILLDVSGSTEEMADQRKVIDIEKHAALILGQGLDSLGDRFSICGFSGNGRENCEYYVFKDFDDRWGREPINRIFAARPLSSTRIGVALRHSGWRLSRQEARQRLIILITDGKPMDSGYDPNTRYAQYDVRMACEENKRRCIHTFCISTEENSRADMEIMFPDRRFVILPDIRHLPRVLPKLYIKMTA